MHSLIGSLEQLLSETVNADVFAPIPEKIQRLALNDILPEGSSDLVEAIIQSVKQVSQIYRSSVVCEVLLHFHVFTFLDRA